MRTGFPDEFPFNRRSGQSDQVPAPVDATTTLDTAEDEAAEAAVATEAASIMSPPAVQPMRTTPVARPPNAPASTSGIERRRAVRQTLVARATIRPITNYAGMGTLAAGYLSNISMKGLGLHARRPLVVGECYAIKLEVGPMRWQSRVRVVTCAPHGSGVYDVGAEFIANELQIRVPRDMAA